MTDPDNARATLGLPMEPETWAANDGDVCPICRAPGQRKQLRWEDITETDIDGYAECKTCGEFIMIEATSLTEESFCPAGQSMTEDAAYTPLRINPPVEGTITYMRNCQPCATVHERHYNLTKYQHSGPVP